MMKKAFAFGFFIGLALIAYFLLMKLLGQEENLFLRLFNFLILIFGAYPLLKSTVQNADPKVTYFEGLGLAVRATVTSVVVFLLFLVAYVKLFDPEFMVVLENSEVWGSDLTIAQAGAAILIEGLASSLVISFAWMQYFKRYTTEQKLKS